MNSHAGGVCCVQVGLGTDVAGGYSPSMLSAMRSAVVASKAVRMLHIDAARRQAKRSDPSAAPAVGTPPAKEGSAAAGASVPEAVSPLLTSAVACNIWGAGKCWQVSCPLAAELSNCGALQSTY